MIFTVNTIATDTNIEKILELYKIDVPRKTISKTLDPNYNVIEEIYELSNIRINPKEIKLVYKLKQ